MKNVLKRKEKLNKHETRVRNFDSEACPSQVKG